MYEHLTNKNIKQVAFDYILPIYFIYFTYIFYLKGPSRCASSIICYISTVNTQHMQGRDVLLQLGYTWRHVSAVKRPFSGQLRTILF